MYKKIIVALALNQGHGVKALNVARKLLDENGEIIAVHVLEPLPGSIKNYMPANSEEEIMKRVDKDMAERIGEEKDAERVILVGHPGRQITEYADASGADCIVIGSHKPELKDFFLGSTAGRVVRHAHCAVHVLRKQHEA